MKQSIIIILVSLLAVTTNSFSQGTDGVLIDPNNATTRDASAVFQAQSISQGVLVSRLTAAQRAAIATPATGLIVYQTDGTPGFYYYNGTVWVLIANTSGNVTGFTGNLAGEVTGPQGATVVGNAAVIGKVLTGYTSGAGIITAADNILQAIQKLNGNDATNANLTGPITSVGNATSIASQTGTGTTFAMSASPVFTGTPSLPTGTIGVTQVAGTNNTTLATTAFVTAANGTNANLTGPITSIGNATSVASQTGSGSTFVMNTSPTLITPVIGAATGTSLSVTGVLVNGGFDFILGNTDQVSRGNSGSSRALVKEPGSVLTLNYAGDFTGGTRVGTLTGTGTRVVVADANGTLTATTSIGSGIISGSGTQNYIPKWNNAAGTTLGNSLITDDATTITAGGQFDVTGGTGTSYTTAPIEIRTSAIAPRLAFHYSGVVASQIAIENSGTIAIRDNPGTGYENFIARDISANRNIYNQGILYHRTSAGQGSGAHGISWYDPSFVTWYDYMAPPGTTNAPSGTAAPQDAPTGVTSWARRFNMENIGTYGWLFESGANTAGVAPTVKFAINASTGTFHATGDGDIDGVVYAGASARLGTNISGGYYQDATNGAYRAIVGSGTTNGYYFQTNAGATTTMYVGLGGTYNGNVGIGNLTPAARLQVTGGAIRPEQGNAAAAGINWGADIFGGGGDQAWMRYYSEGGENTRLVIGNENDADDEIAFYQTGAERMTIYNGNIGIGTTGPTSTLDVNGSTRLRSLTAGMVKSDASGNLSIAGGGDLPSHTHTWAQVTAKPAAWLDGATLIQDNNNFNNSMPSGFYQSSGATNAPGGSWYNMINVRHSNTGNDHGFQMAMSYYDEYAYTRTYQGGTGANNGTFTPWARHLTNRPGDWELSSNSTSTGYGGATLELRESNYTNNGSATPPHLGFHWGGVVASNISIESDGKISILNNPGTSYENIIANRYFASTTSNSYERTSVANGIWGSESLNNTSVHIYNSESEQGGFFANGDYNGIYSPGDNDLVKFMDEDFFNNSGTVYDASAMRARIDGSGNYYAISDRNAKENIVQVTDALNKIQQINGYTYYFKRNEVELAKNSPLISGAGVIAQELETVLPEAVSNTDGHYMVNYSAISALFIEAIKEQQLQIEELKTLNLQMQVRINALETKK